MSGKIHPPGIDYKTHGRVTSFSIQIAKTILPASKIAFLKKFPTFLFTIFFKNFYKFSNLSDVTFLKGHCIIAMYSLPDKAFEGESGRHVHLSRFAAIGDLALYLNVKRKRAELMSVLRRLTKIIFKR